MYIQMIEHFSAVRIIIKVNVFAITTTKVY